MLLVLVYIKQFVKVIMSSYNHSVSILFHGCTNDLDFPSFCEMKKSHKKQNIGQIKQNP